MLLYRDEETDGLSVRISEDPVLDNSALHPLNWSSETDSEVEEIRRGTYGGCRKTNWSDEKRNIEKKILQEFGSVLPVDGTFDVYSL